MNRLGSRHLEERSRDLTEAREHFSDGALIQGLKRSRIPESRALTRTSLRG